MAQTVTASNNAQGIARGAYGVFTGDGTIVTVNLGFKPKCVRLINLTDVITYEKIDGMSATQSIKTVATGTMTLDTGSAIVLNANASASGATPATTGGFTVPAAVGINAKSFVWYAE